MNHDLKETVIVDDDRLFSLKDIRLAQIKEQAIILSGEINEYCNRFRDRLRNGLVLGYTDIIAKLYYDIACANYKYYSQHIVKDNLFSIKQYLEKSINEFDRQNSITNHFSIVKDVQYFLDSICDLYLILNIDQNNPPTILGNAVVLVKTELKTEYICYFVENDIWIKDNIDLKSIRIKNIHLENIEINSNNRLVYNNEKSRKNIESIIRKAQLERGHASINIIYYSLKRKRKHIENRLLNVNNQTDSIQILLEIIECNLEIGCIEQVEYYIDILKKINGQEFKDKLDEYELRKELIIKLRQSMQFEISLSLPNEDNKKYLIVKNFENMLDYNIELDKWKKIYQESDNRSILFIFNSEKEQKYWECWIWLPNKTKEFLKFHIEQSSPLDNFLNYIHNKVNNSYFYDHLLDILNDEDRFQNFQLKSQRSKMIDYCDCLYETYHFIGHYPLEQYYHRAKTNLLKENTQFQNQISSLSKTNFSNENQFPLSLFPISLDTGVKKLNDRIDEKEFFSEILPYINQINDLKLCLNAVYNIDWQYCSNLNNKEIFLQDWREKYSLFQKENPLEKKYLFLLIECNFYFMNKFDKNKFSTNNENAIVLTKIENSLDYNAFFYKDNRWLKINLIKGLQNRIVKNLQLKNVKIDKETHLIDKETFQNEESRYELEKIAVEMNLNRWYFYGEINNGRISEGFIDQKREFEDLWIYLKDILPMDLKKKKNLFDKESKILDHLSKIFQINHEISLEKFSFLKSKTSIQIYDLRKTIDGNNLRKEIQLDLNIDFICIVRLSTKHYVSLHIEKKIPYKYNYYLRYIYVINSAFEKINFKLLNWFTGVMNNCVYKLRSIECPKQRLMSEDSFLHAYLNASACQWATNNNHWNFLKKNFSQQNFSTKQSIEKIKQSTIEVNETTFTLNYTEDNCSDYKTIEIIEKFKSYLSEIIQSSFSNVKLEEIQNHVEYLSKTFASIKIFDEILESIRLITNEEIPKEIDEHIKTIEEYTVVNSIVDFMFQSVKTSSLNLLEFHEKLYEDLEDFKDRLHHTILLIMTETKTNHSIIDNRSFEPIQKLQISIEKSSNYEQFVESFEKFLKTEKQFLNSQELLSKCQTIRTNLSNGTAEKLLLTNQIAEKNFKIILKYIQRFANIERSLKDFYKIFQCLLPYCYELLELSEINTNLRDDIYEKISSQKSNFDDIKNCIDGLFNKIHTDSSSIKIDFNIDNAKQKLKIIYQSLDECISIEDKRSIHYLGTHLRTTMLDNVDYYMNSLALFRHKSLHFMEIFDKSFHQFLLNLIRESIKEPTKINLLLKEALSCFPLKDLKILDYDKNISIYINIVHFFTNKNNTILFEFINSLLIQIQDKTHSHSIYIQTKLNDLFQMIKRFVNVAEVLPKFSKYFREALNDRYDHLSEYEAFSTNGKIKNEIFDNLKQNRNFDDIKKIIIIFEKYQNDLFNIIKPCEQFVNDNDERGCTEISECLRQCIIDITEDYVSKLLAFRHSAITAFNHFEINFYDLLSTYEIIQNKKFRSSIENTLNQLNKSNDNYDNYLSIYKDLVNYLNKEEYECGKLIKDIIEEKYHTLKPLIKDKINNLKMLLNNYINWYDIETYEQNEYIIFQIKTHSTVLSKILFVLQSKYNNYFCPNNEIRIINIDKLYIDIDLSSEEYSGVNLVLISPYQILVENKINFKINTNGKNAKDIWLNKPAKNAHGTDSNRKGNKGEDGSDGKNGRSAGHVYLVANQLPDLDISACCGKGGRGQDGGIGASGSDGADGKNADKEALIKELSKDWALIGGAWSYRYRRIGTDGEPAGWGGDAGSGGFHGENGNCGLVKVIALDNISSSFNLQNSVDKFENENGKPGRPGTAGKHGKDGLDYVAISNWIGIHRAGFVSRVVNNLKGGRINSNERYNKNEEQQTEDYYMLSMEDDEGNSRFKGKYIDVTAQLGASCLINRHKDQEILEKIHSINYHHVFQQTAHFFIEFINPKKLISYQHWVASSLNNFLAKMAALEESPSFKIQILPDIEHDAKELLILKDNFLRNVHQENQRLNIERHDTNQMNIGINVLSHNITNEYNQYLNQHQAIYQKLQDEIQTVDINQLETGLQNRSIEIANLKNSIIRIINKKRFHQTLIQSQRHTEVFVDIPKQQLLKSISNRKNIIVIKDNLLKQRWKKFQIENTIVDKKLIKEFNQRPNEKSLLIIAFDCLIKLETIKIETIDLNNISHIFYDYLYNLQQANYNFEDLKYIQEQIKILNEILIIFQYIENSLLLDLLIEFSKGLYREYLRQYWLIRIMKTLKYSRNISKKFEINLQDIFQTIRILNHNQLEQIDLQLKSSFLLKEFSFNNFDKELKQSIDKFNQISDENNLLEVFQYFEKSTFFTENLIDHKKLDIINDFFSTYQHNLNLLNFNEDQFNILTNEIIIIECLIIKHSRSYLNDIIFHFSLNIEKLKVKNSITPDKNKQLDEIHQSHDLYKLLNFHSSITYKKDLNYDIVQQINGFNTLYDLTLAEDIFKNLENCKDINKLSENETIIGFIKWITTNFEYFQYEIIKNMLRIIKTILQSEIKSSFRNSLQFLRITFDYRIIKLEIEKHEEKIIQLVQIEKENSFKIQLLYLTEINNFSQQNSEDIYRFYFVLKEILSLMNIDDAFFGISDDKLNEAKTSYERTLKNLSNKIENQKHILTKLDINTFQNKTEFEDLKNNFLPILKQSIDHIKENIQLIIKQQNDNRILNHNKLLLITFDKLFSNIENIDDDMRHFILNILKVKDLKPDQTLFNINLSDETLNFYYFIYEIKSKIDKNLITYLKQNVKIDQIFDNKLKEFFFHHIKDKTIENILLNLGYPFINILNLSKYSPHQNANDILKETIDNLNTSLNSNGLLNLREKIMRNLIKSYLTFKKLTSLNKHMDEYYSNKKFSNEDKIKDYEIILHFFYEESNKKSKFIEEIYVRFYDYCQKNNNKFSLCLINLMDIINRVHRESFYPDKINLDYAQFQVILIHTILERNSPLGNIDNELIDFLHWLYKVLSNYELIDNIEINHIKQLDRLSKSIDKLCENRMNQYLKKAFISINKEIKLIFINKTIENLFKNYSNKKWLEVIIYFPEYFIDNNDQLFYLIINNNLNSMNVQKIDEIQNIIFQRILIIQNEKLNKFYELIFKKNSNHNNIENGFKELKGYLNKIENNSSFDKYNPYEILCFNKLIETFNKRLEIDGGCLIHDEVLLKVQQCLACFEDIRIVTEYLSSSVQYDWLKISLIENIIEKYSFIYSDDDQIENIRHNLMRVDEKLLLLFNNIFMNQYIYQIDQNIDLNRNSNSTTNYQKLSREKLIIIVKLISEINVTSKILNQLSDASLTIWDILLYEIIFSQIFNREMIRLRIELEQDGIEKILLFLNRIRVGLGIENNDKFLEFFQNISDKMIKSDIRDIKILNQLLEAIHYQRISFEQAHNIFLKFDCQYWIEEFERIISLRLKNTNRSDRSAKEIIDLMINQQNNKTNVIRKEILEQITQETIKFKSKARNRIGLEGDEKSKINREIQDLLNLKSYQDNPEIYVRSHLNEIIPLIIYSWLVANKSQFPKDSQIIALLIFIHSEEYGLLEQVRTGEGKTLIVGLTAAFFALCGYAVDIVSSNRDLAIEGERKCRSFFQLLKLDSSHICNENDEVNHQSYRPDINTYHGNIVYGEVGGFQKDILEEEFNNKKIFGKRYENRKKCLIIDEVDNMSLDRARHVLYLSHEIQCLKCLETLFINIWAAVLSKEIHHSNQISEYIEDISQFLKQQIKNTNIFVPDYMHDYVNYKIKRWVDNAFQARIMRVDDHFVLDVPKTDEQINNKKQKTIIVLDKDTGIEQYSTRWSHGLAQFLELKYRQKLSIESLKAVFISNKAFFQRYKNHLYGLTGTLGSEKSQNFLYDLYHVQFAELPTSREKQYFQYPTRISLEYNDWLDLIAKESIEQSQKRPVLIICDNVESTEHIWNELIRHGFPPHTIERYRRDGDNIEERFRKKPATANDIIIATNKGGRGTDIHVDPQVNNKEGMHVILTYLPENVRIEEQAFGRTARNGAAGTGQFILQVDKSIYEEMYELNQYPNKKRQEKLDELAEIILEREKINRDNGEAARLSELKQKNILRLEVEEELFDKFNQFKKNIVENISQSLSKELSIKNKSEKFLEKLIESFEHILKDRWAFWLDKAKEKIDLIETYQQKNVLIIEFNSSFINKLQDILQNRNFDYLIKNFIEKPEETIEIARVCFSENECFIAKKCLEKSIECGDVSGFAHIGLAYSIIKLNNGENVGKKSRRELKKAQYLLELSKKNLMANLKIADFLSRSSTSDILQKMSKKDNFYEDQIRGKLEVIGIHLHYLKRAIGNTVEPFDFILHITNIEKLTKEHHEKGEKIYNLLVKNKIIQGDRLRKVFRNDSKVRENMIKVIQDNIDPSIADQLISLLNRKTEFEKTDFEELVCYNDEIWEMLSIENFENVFILNKSQIVNNLPEEYEKIWKDLENRLDPNQIDLSIFDESSENKKFLIYLQKKNILIQTKRTKLNKLDINNLKFNGKYSKYSKIKFNDNGHETKDLKRFLIELKEYLSKHNEYIYQTDLPFGTKEYEANKIRIFLKEKLILKSGGLAIHKYGNNNEEIKKLLDQTFTNTEFENDKDLILSKILYLQGDIRSSEDGLKANFKDFIDLQELEIVPSELSFFEGIGLNKFLIIQEDKSWWDWNAFAVAMIGVAQIIGGAVLIICGFPNLGMTLISEGISDMMYATMAGLSGTFSWKDWAIQKRISLSISIFSFGIGKLTSIGSTAAKIGSVSKAGLFANILRNAANQFATTYLTNILTEKIMEGIKNTIIPMIVNRIEEKFLKGILNSINKKLENLYETSKDENEFEKSFKDMKIDLERTLGKNKILSKEFENIRIQVISVVQNNYETLITGLSNSSSKYAKIAATVIKSTVMIDKLFNAVQSVLQLASAINTLNRIIEGSVEIKNNNVNKKEINPEYLKTRINQLNNIIKEFIYIKLTKILHTILSQIISGALKKINEVITEYMKTMIDSTYDKNKNNRKSQIVVEQPSPNENNHNDEENETKKREDLQNNIINPQKQLTDANRPMSNADIKMLAEKEKRYIIVNNKDTGKTQVFKPSGLGYVIAFFKQSANINFEKDKDEDIGHFTSGLGNEEFTEVNGQNNCLLIAYNTSLGREIDENIIKSERNNLLLYIDEHKRTFDEYVRNESSDVCGIMIGGAQKGKQKLFENEDEVILRKNRKVNPSKSDGTYKTRYHERARLEQEEGINITAETHEFEHSLSWKALVLNADPGLNVSRKNSIGKTVQDDSPAYAEKQDRHRKHPGTGSGLVATNFRKDQYTATIVEKNPGDAIQLSLVEYAQQPGYVADAQTKEGKAATNSFQHMIKKTDSVPWIELDGTIGTIAFDPEQQRECLWARWICDKSRYPTETELKENYYPPKN